ncbi:hypothetical protein AB0J25_27005 [Streptomyces sp. NPDC049910]|uniref:DUF6895 family protein n=1 Tax=Streptomyces sp. NPDC049910 TaxID=3155278 RepID=UPI003440C813
MRSPVRPSAGTSGENAAILEQVEDAAAQHSYREMVARDETALLLYAGTYAALRLCGRDAPEFGRVIRQAVAGRYAAAFERVPYRQLDLLHTLYLCGIEPDPSSMDAVLPFTLLCRRPNVLKLTDRDVYAVTHTIFYATDFGLREPAWPSGFRPGEGTELLEALLVLAEARANADLVGELLCCLYCLGAAESHAADRAWAFLESVQDDNGRVNGPEGILHPGTDTADGDFRHWAEGYHTTTTVVAALAGLLERSPRRRSGPPPPPPAEAVSLGVHLRRAVKWLCDASMAQDHRSGLPGQPPPPSGRRRSGNTASPGRHSSTTRRTSRTPPRPSGRSRELRWRGSSPWRSVRRTSPAPPWTTISRSRRTWSPRSTPCPATPPRVCTG